MDGCILPTPGDFLSIPEDRPGSGDNYNAQEPPKPRASPFPGPKLHQEDVCEHALTKPLSSMSYFLPVLLIPHKSSAACWPRSDYFPLLKTSLPRSSLFAAKFRSFLSGSWVGFFRPFLAKRGKTLQPERQGLPRIHQVPPGSGSPTPWTTLQPRRLEKVDYLRREGAEKDGKRDNSALESPALQG